MVRVEVRSRDSARAVLQRAQRRIEALVGVGELRLASAPAPREAGRSVDCARSHRHLRLDDIWGSDGDDPLVRAANRLADRHPQRSALVFDMLERFEPAMLDELADVMARPNPLRLPLVFGLHEIPDDDECLTRLLESVVPECVESGPSDSPDRFGWHELESTVHLVMRAAAAVGTTFRADDVAYLLDQTPQEVLLQIQHAVDHGAPLIDCGGGRFSMTKSARQTLMRHALPSLAEQWRCRLWQRHTANQAANEPQPTRRERAPVAQGGSSPWDSSSSQTMQQPVPSEVEVANGPVCLSRPPVHAIEQYVQAMDQMMAREDFHRALLIADQALKLLARVPPSLERELMWARVLIAAARTKWTGAGEGPTLTRLQALSTLEEASTRLPQNAPLDVHLEIGRLAARVCRELADARSLHKGFDVLSSALEALEEREGMMVSAVRALGRRATTHLRRGDVTQARDLLPQFLRIFDALEDSGPEEDFIAA